MKFLSEEWLVARAIKKELAGRGPYTLYRCQKCWGCFFEVDILGTAKEPKTGLCPKCHTNYFERAITSFFENFKAVFRILRGK